MSARTRFLVLALLLAAGAAPAAGAIRYPSLAVEPAGRAHFGWVADDGMGMPMRSRALTAGGAFTERLWVSHAGGFAQHNRTAADETGRAVHMWEEDEAFRAYRARRRGADGSLGPVLVLSSTSVDNFGGSLATDPDGDTAFVWLADNRAVRARQLSRTGALGPLLTITSGQWHASGASVAIDAAGNAILLWTARDPVENRGYLQMRRVAAGGTVEATQTLAAAQSSFSSPEVAFDAAGNALLAWVRDGVPQVRRRTPGGALSATQSLAPAQAGASALDLAVNDAGAAMLTWTARNTVQARHRAAGGTLGSLLTLTPPSETLFVAAPRATMDPQGDALVVWQRFDVQTAWLEGRRRTAGGTVGPNVRVTPVGEVAARYDVGVADSGAVTLTWEDLDDGVKARRRRPDGTFGPVMVVGR